MRLRAQHTLAWTLATVHAHELNLNALFRFTRITLPLLQDYAEWEQYPQHPRMQWVWNEEWWNSVWATERDPQWPTQRNINPRGRQGCW